MPGLADVAFFASAIVRADALQQAIGWLRAAERITVLTGAGVSKESGVPTFRDAQSGLWAKYDPQALASPQGFRADPGLVWRWYALAARDGGAGLPQRGPPRARTPGRAQAADPHHAECGRIAPAGGQPVGAGASWHPAPLQVPGSAAPGRGGGRERPGGAPGLPTLRLARAPRRGLVRRELAPHASSTKRFRRRRTPG